MNWQWVTDDAALLELVTRLRAQPAVAVDTEFRRRDTFFPQVALVQLAIPDGCWLIDPLQLTDPTPLATLLTDPQVIKILHSASEDLEVFEHWLGVLPAPLFDTQRAAGLLNIGVGLSYRALVQQLLGIELAKDETQSDWLARPLSDAQCQYAAQDVACLIECWPELSQRALAQGAMDWVLADGAAMSTGGRGPLAKFKSAWKLKPAQLAVLLALVEWREQSARERDKPRSWVLADKVITELALRPPVSMGQLSRVAGLPAPVLRRDGKQLLALMAEAQAAAADHPPARLPGPASAEVRQLAKRLNGALDALAETLGSDPAALLSNRDLEAIARDVLGEPAETPDSWQGWRGELVVKPLKQRALALLEA